MAARRKLSIPRDCMSRFAESAVDRRPCIRVLIFCSPRQARKTNRSMTVLRFRYFRGDSEISSLPGARPQVDSARRDCLSLSLSSERDRRDMCPEGRYRRITACKQVRLFVIGGFNYYRVLARFALRDQVRSCPCGRVRALPFDLLLKQLIVGQRCRIHDVDSRPEVIYARLQPAESYVLCKSAQSSM
jgi:hypothetical protein